MNSAKMADHDIARQLQALANKVEQLQAAWELSEDATRFLLRTGYWIRQDRERALTMLDRARAAISDGGK